MIKVKRTKEGHWEPSQCIGGGVRQQISWNALEKYLQRATYGGIGKDEFISAVVVDEQGLSITIENRNDAT